VFSFFLSPTQARPSGAAACPGGESAVGGFHVGGGVTSRTLAQGGFTVTIDSVVLSPGASYTFTSGVKHVLRVSGTKMFKGFLFRIGTTTSSGDDAALDALELSETYPSAKISTICDEDGASGVTHISPILKTEAVAILSAIESPDVSLTLDVTIVIADPDLSEHYYSGYSLLSATGPATTTVPTSAPTSKPPPVNICFSGESQVRVLNQGPTKMWDLGLYDMVQVANNKYEPVYSFGHKEASMEAEYLSISTKTATTSTSSNKAELELSKDHMVMTEGGRNVPASHITVGDMLVTASGELVAVESIRTVIRKGSFAPFTLSGSIVVNDLVVSNYVAYQGSEYLMIAGIATPFTFQWLAHTFNAAHRVAYLMGVKGETYNDVGVSHWVEAGHHGAGWLLEQNPFVMLCVLLAGIAFFGTVGIMEAALLMSPVTIAALLAGAIFVRPFASFKAISKKA
jgi:Hint module